MGNRLRHNRLLQLMLIAMFAMRVLMPAGWMTSTADDGSITVRMCGDGGYGGQTITIPLKKNNLDDHQTQGKKHCPFAVAAHGTPLPENIFVLARVTLPFAAPIAPTATGFSPGAASPLPPATGPPLLA